MSLYIYKCKEPESVIYDSNKFFLFHQLKMIPEVAAVIRDLERGELGHDTTYFVDRFGYHVRIEDMSVTTKAVINILLNPDKCFFTGEIGTNGLEYLMYYVDGHVYMPQTPELDLEPWFDFEKREIYVDDVRMHSIMELEDALYED